MPHEAPSPKFPVPEEQVYLWWYRWRPVLLSYALVIRGEGYWLQHLPVARSRSRKHSVEIFHGLLCQSPGQLRGWQEVAPLRSGIQDKVRYLSGQPPRHAAEEDQPLRSSHGLLCESTQVHAFPSGRRYRFHICRYFSGGDTHHTNASAGRIADGIFYTDWYWVARRSTTERDDDHEYHHCVVWGLD